MGLEFTLEPLKEPRGFIRLILLFLAIFAFATTTSFSSKSNLQIKCAENETDENFVMSYSYPGFRLDTKTNNEHKFCSHELVVSFYGDFTSQSQFYVFVGVMAFLFCLASLIFYLLMDARYQSDQFLRNLDFFVTIGFFFFFFVASCVWAQGVSDLKLYSYPETWILNQLKDICKDNVKCGKGEGGDFAKLNVSLLFGFLNAFVWGGNIWFTFKESSWFSRQQDIPEDLPHASMATPPQQNF